MKRLQNILFTAVLLLAGVMTSCSASRMARTASGSGNTEETQTVVTPDKPFETALVDTAPIPPQGTIEGFRDWVTSRLTYPEDAYQLNISGIVIVSFVIGLDGNVTDIDVLQTPHESLSAEVCRVIGSSPAWQPATKDGAPAYFMYVFPVIFQID